MSTANQRSIREFVEWLATETETKPITVQNYGAAVRRLAEYATKPLDDITAADVRSFLYHNRKLSASSRGRWTSGLRRFYQYRLKHGGVKEDPTAGLAVGWGKKRRPEPPPRDLWQKIAALPDRETRRVAEFLAHTGLRYSDADTLRPPVGDVITVRGVQMSLSPAARGSPGAWWANANQGARVSTTT